MNNGRVKKQYLKPRSNRPKYYLEAGQRGFFCTCNFREKDCVKEAYNLLNEYGDKLYGSSKDNNAKQEVATSQDEAAGGEEEVDISEQLEKELEEMKTESKKKVWEKRYQAVETGANNCVFIRTSLPNPEEITTAIFKDLMETKEAKTRYLLRILPIMATCKTTLLDITEAAGKLFDRHFLKEPSTFAIIFNRRYHSKLTRDDVIKELADLIAMKNSGNKADLKHPQKAVIVEIIKGTCLLSVVENFFEYRKYNLFELCKKDEKGTDEKEAQGETELQDEPVEGNEVQADEGLNGTADQTTEGQNEMEPDVTKIKTHQPTQTPNKMEQDVTKTKTDQTTETLNKTDQDLTKTDAGDSVDDK